MKRTILWLLIGTSAIGVCMWGIQKASAQQQSLAVCRDGKCEMSEADYRQLQDFVARMVAASQEGAERETKILSDLEESMGALEACRAQRRHHNVSGE